MTTTADYVSLDEKILIEVYGLDGKLQRYLDD